MLKPSRLHYLQSPFRSQSIPVDTARWIASILDGIDEGELHTIFTASGYDDATTTGFAREVRRRVRDLSMLSLSIRTFVPERSDRAFVTNVHDERSSLDIA